MSKIEEEVKVYTLTVYLIQGPMTEEFEGEEISRTVRIRGDQTLEDLHRIIFGAFDRWEKHGYEFNLGEGPRDQSEIYTLSSFLEEGEGDVSKTAIDSLGLEEGRAFGYLFDFGDNWLHQIDVIGVEEPAGVEGEYPKITNKIGESPPQYPD